MAEPFDIGVVTPQERPSTEALNRAQSAARRAETFFYEQTFAERTAPDNDRAVLRSGIIGEAFKVRPVAPLGLSVEVSAGIGFHYDPSHPLIVATDAVVGPYAGVNDLSPYRPLVLPLRILAPVPPVFGAGMERVDLIEVRPKRELSDYGTLLRYDRGAADFRPKSGAAFLRYSIDQPDLGSVATPNPSTTPLSYVTGTPAPIGAAFAPYGTPGYQPVAYVVVHNGDTGITKDRIVDLRTYASGADISGVFSITTVPGKRQPAMEDLDAPPGVEVSISSALFPINPAGWFTLIVIAGVSTLKVTRLNVTPVDGTGAGNSPVVPNIILVKNTTVGSSGIPIRDLADPAITSPPIVANKNQPIMVIRGGVSKYNAATQKFDGTPPDPLRCVFDLRVR